MIKTVNTATGFTLIFSVMTALILPVGYFAVSYKYLLGIMETEAEINSQFVSRLITANPELWRYETIRIEELLARRPRSGATETRRLFDAKNLLVAESTNSLPSPRVKVSQVVRDGGETVARIEISRSILPILLHSGVLAMFGLCFGLLLYRYLPFKAVIRTGKQLQDANDFLMKVMEGSTNSLVVLDPAGNIQMFNGRFEALSGLTKEDLMGRPFSSLFSGDPLTRVVAELQKVSTGKGENAKFETVLSRRDGLPLNLLCGAVPLSSGEQYSGMVLSLDDVTERINAEEERLALERYFQQTQKLESLGVLAGGIAHDFNNILTIIMGYCYVLKDDIDPVSTDADYVQRIEDAANRAADLCQQMLSYAGKNELRHSQINMCSLLDEMVKMLHSGIKKNVAIELELPDILLIVADNSQIQQVVMNLIINAAEAIGENNGTIRIALEETELLAGQSGRDFTGKTIPAGRYVCLEVSDDGCGMDEETQGRVFEPFYTTKFAGRGLGMSATLGIIKSHDGVLQMASSLGTGTTFRVYLPLPAAPAVSDPADDKPAEDEAAARAAGTILLVDDEEALRVVGPIRLRKIGFSAITAATGIEALSIYRRQGEEIVLILLDLLMPEMGGIETYYRLREISMTIPIVFCSGCSITELSPDILADERTGFLKKPYKPDQLRRVLMEMLG